MNTVIPLMKSIHLHSKLKLGAYYVLLKVIALTFFTLLFSYSAQAATKLSVTTNNVSHDYDVSSYGGPNQDKTGTVEIRDAGLSLFLEGNRWQKIVFPYTVTADTVIEFDFQSTVQGEVHGLGFDDDLAISPNRSFKVYGTQNWGLSTFATYKGNGVTHFKIPVGQFYTGTFQYLFFINDDDSNPTGNSLYSNIVIYDTSKALLEYRFEETSWNGTAGEVIDNSGSGYHGRVRSNSTPLTPLPALTGNLGTCGYASQNNGSIEITGLPLDSSTIGVKTTVTFWMNWDGTNNVMPIGWDTHDIWLNNGSMGFNTGNSDIYGISSAGLANGWHHVAVEFTNGSVTNNKMYIDGVEQVLTQRLSSPNNSRAIVDSELRIGGWSRGSGYEFHGLIDEVRVYQNSLTTSQINTIMAERHPCPSMPIAEYRFDELSWDGMANEVIDNSGNNHHGDAIGMTTLPSGKVCSAGDFTTTGTSDYLSLANSAANNLTDFTVSVWAMKNFTHTGTIISGANSGQRNEMIMFFPNNDKFSPYIKGSNVSFDNGGIGDGSWHHLVWTRTGTTQCYYVDGAKVQCGTIGQSGSLNISPGGLIIGQEQDSLGGSFDANQAWDGLLDELIIFDSALPVSQINGIYTNQDAGNNYDGSARSCPTPATPLLEYRFEEASWNGVAGEILDSTGNGHHAQALRDSILVNPAPATAQSAIPGDPGTCGYTSQTSGSIQTTGLPLDITTAGVKTTVTFWMNWNGIENVMPIGWDVHDIWMISGSMGFNTGSGDLYGISSAGLANGWHHVAVEFTNGSVTNNRMYIDGVEQVLTQRRNSPNNGRAVVDSEFRVGGWQANASYDFQGFMDEVRIYQGVLTTIQINTIMNEVHPCNTPIIDHYEIVHDGQGLTCDTESVEVKACTNVSCSNLSTQSVTLDFLADGALISSPTFTGSTIVNFNHTVVETLTFSVANATLAASNAIVCDDGSSASCDMAFTDAGFRFLSGTGNSTTILNQTSGTVFSEALKLQAVKSVNGICTGLFTGNKNVDLSQENIAPSGISGLSFSIDNNTKTIAKHSNVTNTTLNFGANSIATIPTPIYHDAGQIRLHAHYNVGGVTLFGSSNPFWVSPAELVVSAKSGTTNLNGDTAGTTNLDGITPTPTHKAGENFILSVTAYNAASVITPNYSPGQIQFMLKRTGPTLGNSVDGDLIYGGGATSKLGTSTSPTFQNVTLTNFSSGFSIYGAAQYSEVGLLNLDVQDSNYGNANIIIPATAINIGRFIPDYFEQTVAEQGSFDAVCNQNTPFAYTGQTLVSDSSKGAISYLVNPIVELTAKNIHGDTTKNYTETGYMKLISAADFIVKPTTDSTINGKNTPIALLPLQANLFAGTVSHDGLVASDPSFGLPLAAGVLHYELADADDFLYPRNKNAEVNAQDNDIDFIIDQVNFVDSDGIGIKNTVDITATASVNIRFGRAYLENSFGPEPSNLTQILSTQYLDTNGRYTINMQDDCTDFDKTKMTIDSGTLNKSFTGVDSDVFTGLGLLDNGETRAMYLTAPGAGNQGNIGVSYDIYDWLKYDWNNNTVDDNPSAVATFGLYRGNDRIIYSREVFD